MERPHTPTRNPPLVNHETTTRRKAKFFEAFLQARSNRVNLGFQTFADTW